MQVFETMIFPILTMMGLAFLYSTALRTTRKRVSTDIAFGGMFGTAVILAMMTPITLGDGLIFDLRGLLVGLAVVFAGWIAGLVALTFGILYRFYVGGAGLWPGVVGLLLAYAIGYAWHHFDARRKISDLASDVLFGVLITFALAGMLLLPLSQAMDLLHQIAPLLMACNVLGAVVLGFVLRREAKFVADTERLRFYASFDPLTQLLNRRGAADEVRKIGGRAGEGRALFYFDVDRFKVVNDIHGHAAGDEALATVAMRIEACVRERVIFSRHGGDEFTLFMPNVSEENVAGIAERFRRSVSDQPMYFRGERIDLSISVGAYWTSAPTTFEDMLHHADTELMRAKSQGRNRICVNSGVVRQLKATQDWALTTAVH